MKIRAKSNFGFRGENIAPGTVLDVTPDDFGGTYKDHIAAGLIEEVVPEAVAEAPAEESPAAPVAEVADPPKKKSAK